MSLASLYGFYSTLKLEKVFEISLYFLQFAGLLRVNHTEYKEPQYTYLSRYGFKLVYNFVLVKNAAKSNKKVGVGQIF